MSIKNSDETNARRAGEDEYTTAIETNMRLRVQKHGMKSKPDENESGKNRE